MTYAWQRSSYVRYTSRPGANRRAARWAWDHFAKDGPIKTLWLGEGYWMVERPDGFSGSEFDEIEAEIALWHTQDTSKGEKAE